MAGHTGFRSLFVGGERLHVLQTHASAMQQQGGLIDGLLLSRCPTQSLTFHTSSRLPTYDCCARFTDLT
eukprot:26860-Eustigmatos_ZCMA.PRE.1